MPPFYFSDSSYDINLSWRLKSMEMCRYKNVIVPLVPYVLTNNDTYN